MAYVTKARLAEYVGSSAHHFAEAKRIQGSVGKSATVFLSHARADKELMEFAAALLVKEKTTVYVDHQDLNLPTTTSPTTADMLRRKMKECDKFVMIAGEKAVNDSRWVPWELGYADGIKPNHVAILPVRDSDRAWTGTEYVGLYPTIEEFLTGMWRVIPPGGVTGQPLSEWLVSK